MAIPSRPLRLDQNPAGRRVEDALLLNLVVQRPEPVTVRIDREAGDNPHHQSQEVHNRANVEEGRSRALVPQIRDDQPRLFCRAAKQLRVAPRARRLRSHEVFSEVVEAVRTNLLRQIGSSCPENPADLRPRRRNRVTAGDQLEGLIPKWQTVPLIIGPDQVRPPAT